MKLFTKADDKKLFDQYSKGSDLDTQMVIVKIFNPYGNGTWFIMNSDPNDPDYLWGIVDLGHGAEVGSISRSDLETYRNRFRLGFERDISFKPINAKKLLQGLRTGEYFADGGNVINAFQIRTIKGEGARPNEIMTTEQEVKFKKGGKVSEMSKYIPINEVVKIHTKDGKVFENIYAETAVLSGIYVSDKPLRQKNTVGENQLELFDKGGMPKSSVYIPRYNIDFIETEYDGTIDGTKVFGGVWIDMKKQSRLIEEAKEKGMFNRKNEISKFEAIYNGKKISIDAKSLSEAKTKAIAQLKVPKTKVGLLSVYNVKDPMALTYDYGGALSDADRDTLIYVNQILRRAVMRGDLTPEEANSPLAFEIAKEEVEEFIDDDMEEMGSSDFGYMYKYFLESYKSVKGESFASGGGVDKLSFEEWMKKNNIEVYKRTYYWVADDGGKDYMYSGTKSSVMKSLKEDYKSVKDNSFAKGGKIEKYLSSHSEMFSNFTNGLSKKEVLEFVNFSKNSDDKYWIRDSNGYSKYLYKGQLRENDSTDGIFYATKIGVDKLNDSLKYKINKKNFYDYEKEDAKNLDSNQNLIKKPINSKNKDWSKFVKDNSSYFDLEEETENYIQLTTRENGSVYDEKYSAKDMQEAKSILKKIKEKYPNTKGNIYTVDEFVYLELEAPKEFAKGGSIKNDDIKVGEVFQLVNGDVIEIVRLFIENTDEEWVEYLRNGESKENSVKELRLFINRLSGKKQKSFRERRNEYLYKLSQKESDVWDKIGAESGSEIRNSEKMLKAYAEGVEEMLQKEGVGKGSFDQEDYDYFQDENSHLLNEFLVWNNYYEPQMTKTEKAWREKNYAIPEYKNYVSNPKIIGLSSDTKSTNYVPKAKIKQIVLEKDGKEILLETKDVLNGVNLYEGGGNLKNDHVYFAKRFVKEVITTDGDKLKPSNGFWVKKDALKTKTEPKQKTNPKFKKIYKFEIGDIVWDKGNKTYGVVLNNYENSIDGGRGEIRLDSDGNQSIFKFDKNSKEIGYNLVPYNSKEDSGNKNLTGLKNSAKSLIEITTDKGNKDYYIKAYSKLLKSEDKNKSSKGGSTTKRGGAMVLAKEIRKDGESWASALKRANEQIRKK